MTVTNRTAIRVFFVLLYQWTGGDEKRAERLFYLSARAARPKWADRPAYHILTIGKAVAWAKKEKIWTYQPGVSPGGSGKQTSKKRRVPYACPKSWMP